MKMNEPENLQGVSHISKIRDSEMIPRRLSGHRIQNEIISIFRIVTQPVK